MSLFCHWCGCHMVIRTRKRDNNPFYGCSGYPKCKYAKTIDPPTRNTGDDLGVLTETLALIRTLAQRVQYTALKDEAELCREEVAACAAALLRVTDYIEMWRPPESTGTWDAIDTMITEVGNYVRIEHSGEGSKDCCGNS